MTTVFSNSDDGRSSRGSSDAILPIDRQPVPEDAPLYSGRGETPITQPVNIMRCGDQQLQDFDVPFFTVARYRNPTAPTTFELAAVPPYGVFGAGTEIPEIDQSIEDCENLTSPAGAGEALYNGSIDLSPVSPVELAFGKSNDSNGGWLGKSVNQRHSTPLTSSSATSPVGLEVIKDEVDNAQKSPQVNYGTPFNSPNAGQDKTPVGCIHEASGEQVREDNGFVVGFLPKTKSYEDVPARSGANFSESGVVKSSVNFDDTPVRGCVNFFDSLPTGKPPVNRPKPNLRSKEKMPVRRRVSAPITDSELEDKTSKTKQNSFHRNSLTDYVTKEFSKEKVLNEEFPKKSTVSESGKADIVESDEVKGEMKSVYEDARVTDAAETLENHPSRSSQQSTPRVPRTPRNRSREPSFCLETESDKYPQTEEEYISLLQKRIAEAHERQLLPLKEDLADWLTKLIGVEGLSSENLITRLDNGVVMCRLANVISSKAQDAREMGLSNLEVPRLPYKTWERARSGTFFARDNISNFLRFCRRLGVHSNLLFETEDLVCGSGVRGVVLCLLEVGRLAQLWWNLEPPGLVKLERELDGEELSGRSDSGYSNASSPRDSTLALNSTTGTQNSIQPPSKIPRQLPLTSKAAKSPSSGSKQQQQQQPQQKQEQQPSSRTYASSHSRSSFPRGPKPIPPPKPASIRRAVSSITKRPTSFPTSKHCDRGWSGAKTTPTTPVTTPTHSSKTRLPVAKTPRSSGRSTPNTTPTTPTQCRRYLVSMQKTPPAPQPSSCMGRATKSKPVSSRPPSRSPSFCSKFQESCSSKPTKAEDSKNAQSDLDNKVNDIAEQTQGLCGCKSVKCSKSHIKKVSEGKYDVLGKNLFVRLLKGKHVMVRVGGGWDTLEHYLLRHDPTQVKFVKSRSSLDSSFLTMKSRYRSPTPSEKSGKGSSSKCLSSRASSPGGSESEKTEKREESFSRQSTPTAESIDRFEADDNQLIANKVAQLESSKRDVIQREKLSPSPNTPSDSLDTGMGQVSTAIKSLESAMLANRASMEESPFIDCYKSSAPFHSHRDGMGSCDLLSAPMGKDGDFQSHSCLSSNPIDSIMVASCPSLDLAESVFPFLDESVTESLCKVSDKGEIIRSGR